MVIPSKPPAGRPRSTTFGRELAFLLVHGVLHLLGYEHDDEASRAEMRAKEEAVLSATGWPR